MLSWRMVGRSNFNSGLHDLIMLVQRHRKYRHSFRTCGGPEILTSPSIFKKCGVITSSERLEHYIVITLLELLYQIYIYVYIKQCYSVTKALYI